MGPRAHSGTHTGHLAERPTVDKARHGPNGSWPSEIPGQRGSGTVMVDHGQIRPCKSLRDRRSEEHTSELQSHVNLVCRLLLEKKKKKRRTYYSTVKATLCVTAALVRQGLSIQ